MKRIQGYRDSIVTSDVWLPSFKVLVLPEGYVRVLMIKLYIYIYILGSSR